VVLELKEFSDLQLKNKLKIKACIMRPLIEMWML
jgi:hypothetical protein